MAREPHIEETPEEARQSEGSRNTFRVLLLSTAVAVGLAIVGYVYVMSSSSDELSADLPELPGEGAPAADETAEGAGEASSN